MRFRLGIVKHENWNGLAPGDPVRVKRAGLGQTVCAYRAHYQNTRRGTEWVDVVVPDGKESYVRPFRPEQIVKVRQRA